MYIWSMAIGSKLGTNLHCCLDLTRLDFHIKAATRGAHQLELGGLWQSKGHGHTRITLAIKTERFVEIKIQIIS